MRFWRAVRDQRIEKVRDLPVSDARGATRGRVQRSTHRCQTNAPLPMSAAPPLTVTAPQLRPPLRYIAIEGPIGVGKTTLAVLLAERWSMRTLFERPQDNPFLERFYRDTTRYALQTQLTSRCSVSSRRSEVARCDVAPARRSSPISSRRRANCSRV